MIVKLNRSSGFFQWVSDLALGCAKIRWVSLGYGVEVRVADSSKNLYVLLSQTSILLGKCACQLPIVSVYLAFGDFLADPRRSSAPGGWTHLGDFCPSDSLCPVPTLPPHPGYAAVESPSEVLYLWQVRARNCCYTYPWVAAGTDKGHLYRKSKNS